MASKAFKGVFLCYPDIVFGLRKDRNNDVYPSRSVQSLNTHQSVQTKQSSNAENVTSVHSCTNNRPSSGRSCPANQRFGGRV